MTNVSSNVTSLYEPLNLIVTKSPIAGVTSLDEDVMTSYFTELSHGAGTSSALACGKYKHKLATAAVNGRIRKVSVDIRHTNRCKYPVLEALIGFMSDSEFTMAS